MKRVFLLVFAAIIALMACNKIDNYEIDNPVTETGTYEFTLTANLDDDLTKSDYDASGNFTWSAGDQISVLFNDGAGNDKYYTLTAASGGSSSAQFSGTIDDGWTIGASDTGKKWALFPAAEHTYNTTTHMPLFRIPSETDFTATHYSASLPMVAELPSDDLTNSFSFMHATGAFKFTFTGLKYTKVKLIVENTSTRGLSGLVPVQAESRNYLNYTASGSSTSTRVSYIANATAGTVSFYVPFQVYRSDSFKPKITLVNLDEGANKDYILLETTAKSYFPSVGWKEIKVVPSATVDGDGTPYAFSSTFGIDWSNASIPSGVGYDGSTDSYKAIHLMKATADASYVYFYFEYDKNKLLLDPSYNYSGSFTAYFGRELNESGDWKWTPKRTAVEKWLAWMLKEGEPRSNSEMNSVFWGDCLYYEYKMPRNKSGLDFLQTDDTAYLGMIVKYGRWNNGSGEQKDATWGSYYSYAPKTSVGYLVVSLPTYVAP